MIKNKDFNILLVGRLIANFGDSLYSIATMLLVYSMTGSALYTGLALFITSSAAIIQVLFSPLLDQINLKRYLIGSQFIQAILLILIPLLNHLELLKVSYIFIIMFVISLINQIIYPAQVSILPKLLNEEELVKANSLFTAAYQGSDALFNAIAGLLITIFGIFTMYYINSATFLINTIVFILLSSLISKLNQNIKTSSKSNRFKLVNHFKQLKNGLSLWKEETLFPLLVGVIFINFASTGIFANLPVFAINEIHYSFLLSTMGVGVLIGAIIAGKKKSQSVLLGHFYIIGIMSIGILWFAMTFISGNSQINIITSLILFFIGWLIVGVLNVFSQTIVQLIVAPEKVGVAMGSMIGISTTLAPLGALTGGIIGNYFGVKIAMATFSMLFVLVAMYWIFNTSIRKLESITNMIQKRSEVL